MKERTDNESVRNCQWQIHGLGMQSGRNKLLINELWQHLEITTGKKKEAERKLHGASFNHIQHLISRSHLVFWKDSHPRIIGFLLDRLFLLVPSFYSIHFVQLHRLAILLKRQRVFNTLFKSTCSNGFVAFDVILCSCTKGRGWLRSQCLSFTEHLGTKTKDFCHIAFHSARFSFLSPRGECRWVS